MNASPLVHLPVRRLAYGVEVIWLDADQNVRAGWSMDSLGVCHCVQVGPPPLADQRDCRDFSQTIHHLLR